MFGELMNMASSCAIPAANITTTPRANSADVKLVIRTRQVSYQNETRVKPAYTKCTSQSLNELQSQLFLLLHGNG